jgi:hypothetical protein
MEKLIAEIREASLEALTHIMTSRNDLRYWVVHGVSSYTLQLPDNRHPLILMILNRVLLSFSLFFLFLQCLLT